MPGRQELLCSLLPSVNILDWFIVTLRCILSSSLLRFYYLGEMSSLLVHNYMTRGIAIYMPNLVELEVR